MSEIVAGNSKCEVGNYHFPPVTVPYVLDVDSGRPLPRTGRQTGRLAVMDLMPENYWGGLLTGDLVTIGGWSDPCDCARHGPYLEPALRPIRNPTVGTERPACRGARGR